LQRTLRGDYDITWSNYTQVTLGDYLAGVGQTNPAANGFIYRNSTNTGYEYTDSITPMVIRDFIGQPYLVCLPSLCEPTFLHSFAAFALAAPLDRCAL
jgi:hypothetical protein